MEQRVGSGLATIEAEPDGTFVLRVDGSLQSRVDLADPTRLLFEYVRRIGDVLDAIAPRRQPVSVLHIGGAALTLPRYVAATRPRSRQIVLEPDEDLTDFVRNALPVPKRAGIKVRSASGRAGITDVYDASVDAVVVDAFEHETVPANLLTAEFVAHCARVLRPAGVAVLNLIDGNAGLPFARRVAATLRTGLGGGVVLAEPPVLRGRRFGNVVLVASRQPVPDLSAVGRSARPPYDVQPLGTLAGNAVPLTDAERFSPQAAPAGTFSRR
ncbi:MAG TPA: fused MFS/spermidine synthase [Kribbellaceae bacterium]|nr:fused MFS/spermidine synthase [Kribbellaceae bacterium]